MQNVRLDIDDTGMLTRVSSASPQNTATLLGGPVICGMPNVHSHAFQRAFAGRAERVSAGNDTFWGWRDAMYGLAQRLSPDDLEAIATQLYVEMLEAGYTCVGEFHYVHHDVDGRPFSPRSEMAQRLIAASQTVGIGLTLLPVFYRWSGFGAAPPQREQARFINDLDGFLAIVDELAPLCTGPQLRLGIAPHSLRAVGLDDLRAVITALDARDPSAPIHLHLAEQAAEVDAAIALTGQRPLPLLLANAAVSARWCLVHATHLDSTELAMLAKTGAVIGLCPTTEANLGDGIFSLDVWRAASGAIAIGSDSHVSVDVAEEVRWLEYTQRLALHKRTITPSPELLYSEAALGGGRALGRPVGALVAGSRADFVVLDPRAPALLGNDYETLLDRYLVAGGCGRAAIDEVYVGGVRLVAGGRHVQREVVAERFRGTITKLTECSRRLHVTGSREPAR